MKRRPGRKISGFTLVEILFVIAIFGVVIGAVYSLYITHQKTAYVQEDLVDLQQNLRIAMDRITRDMRMAGVLVPGGTGPLAQGSLNNYSTSVQINTASANGLFARIAKDKSTSAFTNFSTTVDSPEAVDALSGPDVLAVRIIRPQDRSNRAKIMRASSSSYLVLKSANRNGPSVVIEQSPSGTFAADDLKKGDLIAVAGLPGAAPPDDFDTIVYSRIACPDAPAETCLGRTVNGTTEVVAGNISSIRFSYLYDNGTEDKTPSDTATVRSVRVTINGQTSSTSALSGGPKTRQITSVVKLRNKR